MWGRLGDTRSWEKVGGPRSAGDYFGLVRRQYPAAGKDNGAKVVLSMMMETEKVYYVVVMEIASSQKVSAVGTGSEERATSCGKRKIREVE